MSWALIEEGRADGDKIAFEIRTEEGDLVVVPSSDGEVLIATPENAAKLAAADDLFEVLCAIVRETELPPGAEWDPRLIRRARAVLNEAGGLTA